MSTAPKKLTNAPLKVADELRERLVEAYDGECVKVMNKSYWNVPCEPICCSKMHGSGVV